MLPIGRVELDCRKVHIVSKAQGVADSSRSAAAAVLKAVRTRHVYANLQLPHVLTRMKDPRQASFTTDLVYGTLRWQGFLDALLEQVSHRAVSAIDPDVLDLARLGAYQILFMSVPSYAAVSSSVSLARATKGTRSSAGFLNAVLRKIATRDRQTWEAILTSQIPHSQPLHRLAIRYSHPIWIVRQLASSWMYARGVTDVHNSITPVSRILAADNEPAEVTLTVRPGLMTVQQLSDQVTRIFPHAHISRGRWSPYAVRVKSVTPEKLPAIQQGKAGVEDEGSQVAALVTGMAPVQCAETRWLDLCAGPGGKTALLGSLARSRKIRLWANEVNATRAKLVTENVRALRHAGFDPIEKITVEDGRGYADRHHMRGQFSRVLVDVPCSGLGALRRRPEARWMKSEQELGSLSRIQHDLLVSALDCVAPGGVVAYVTCSPALVETRHVVDAVLSHYPHVIRVNAVGVAEKLLGSKARSFGLSAQGDIQMFADQTQTDMMFVSLLRKY